MSRRAGQVLVTGFLCLFSVTHPLWPESTSVESAGFDSLVSLFEEWRAFQRPPVVDQVPDYTPEAMMRQHAELARMRSRLDGIDPSGIPGSGKIECCFQN